MAKVSYSLPTAKILPKADSWFLNCPFLDVNV